MIIAKVGNLLENIENMRLDGIMNAANGIGPMGAGIAGAIRRYGGVEIQTDAFKVCNELEPIPGDAYSTISGQLKRMGIKRIIHAVTMKKPGELSSLMVVLNSFNNALQLAKKEGIKRIGCTALGTKTGKLDSVKVAEVMIDVAKRQNDIDIIFMDFDKNFIDYISENI